MSMFMRSSGAAATASASITSAAEESDAEKKIMQSICPDLKLEYEQNFFSEENLTSLRTFFGKLDVNNKGYVDAADLDELLGVAINAPMTAGAGQKKSMAYGHLPPRMVSVLRTWDLDGNGCVGIQELEAAALAWRNQKQQMTMQRRLIVILLFMLFLGLVGTFSACFLAMEVTKEVKTDKATVLVGRDGSPVHVASADLVVQGGSLVPWEGAEAMERRLLGCGDGANDAGSCIPPPAVGVRIAEVEKPLSSTIPDHILRNLDKITLKLADGVSVVSLRVHGFARALTPSLCGSLVSFDVLHGRLFLDDTVIYFDEDLTAHLAKLGLNIQGASVHGRRLADEASAFGFFSFFESYEWECKSVAQPRSPNKPYVIRSVTQHVCATEDECMSSQFSQQAKPGYYSDRRSVLAQRTQVETEEFALTIERYPNHPLQQFVSITDHVQLTHKSFQMFEGKAHLCFNRNYSDAVGNSTKGSMDNYFAAYLGDTSRPSEVYTFPWGNATIPSREVRRFRLQPKEGEGIMPIPIDYEDDASTLLPLALHFLGARDLGLDIEAVLVQSLLEGDAADHLEIRAAFDLDCIADGIHVDLPKMVSPFSEETKDVEFYTGRLLAQVAAELLMPDVKANVSDPSAEWPTLFGDFWARSMRAVAEDTGSQNVSEAGNRNARRLVGRSREGTNVDGPFSAGGRRAWPTVEGESSQNRSNREEHARQLQGVKLPPQTLLDLPLKPGGALTITYVATRDGQDLVGTCYTIAGVTSELSPWSLSGSMSVGNTCNEPYSAFTLQGRVEIAYGWGWSTEFWIWLFWWIKVQISASLQIYGYISGTVGTWSHVGPICPPAAGEAEEVDRLLQFYGRRLEWYARALIAHNRKCQIDGFKINAGLGVRGGVSVSAGGYSVGARVEGMMDLEVGPLPDPPHDARAAAAISARACLDILWWTSCLGLPKVPLFDFRV